MGMKGFVDLRFFACAFVMVVVYFMVGLFTYGDVASFVIKNGFFDSPEKYWGFTLINGFVFALVGFVMMLYIWLNMLPKPRVRNFVLLFVKMMVVSLVIYAVGLFFTWRFYASFSSENILFDNDILVSIDELNIYWSAVLLLAFWIFLLMLLVVRRVYHKKNQQ